MVRDDDDAEELAREWHGDAPGRVRRIEVREPNYPSRLIACGVLVSVSYEDHELFSIRKINVDHQNAYLAFDPTSQDGRLYFILPLATKKDALGALWVEGAQEIPLDELARSAGGSHQGGYPDVMVQALGPVLQIEYAAKKYGPFKANKGAVFFHEHESPQPWLAVDEDGRLWYAGGSYDASDLRGIVG